MANPWKWLRVTDGTTYTASGIRREVNLLAEKTGFYCTEWRPRTAEPKGGGVWSDSALAEGRRLHLTKPQNVVETFTFEVRKHEADDLIKEVRALRQLLESAREYWTTGWTTVPVWIEAQGVNETQPRYALIMDYRTPEDGDPFSEPFWQRVLESGMSEFDLIIEREPYWRDNVPGQSDCLEISSMQAFCYSYPLVFDGDAGHLTLGSPAALDNLPSAGAFTVDGWIKADGYGENSAGRIMDKSTASTLGWYITVSSTVGLYGWADFDNTDGEAASTLNDFSADGLWHHVAFVWTAGPTNTFDIYVDGVDVTNTQTNGIGVYQADAAATLYVGNNSAGNRTFDGEIGWMRVSSVARWSADFTRPAQCILPSPDANTEWLGIREGSGTTVYDLSSTAQDGTISLATWGTCCQIYMGNYLPCSPEYMEFNATTALVNCGSDATVDDLPDNAFTVEAWVKADGWGEDQGGWYEGIIAAKNNPPTYSNGWVFSIGSPNGLAGFVDCLTTNAFSDSGASLFSPDSEWHHVAMTFDDAGTRLIRLWIDGVEPTAYQTQAAGVGAYQADAANSLYLGNYSTQTHTWDGGIGWVRISDSLRYTTDFDDAIPPRCTIPAYDANTISVWNVVDPDTLVEDFYNVNEGTPTDLTSACDCNSASRETTCDADTVYITNHHKEAQLTHLFYYDATAAAFSPNLLTQALPYPILPTPVSASGGDAFYVGIDTVMPDTGPFSSVVFDLHTVGSGISFSSSTSGSLVSRWQYWSSTGVDHWEWLWEQDNTNQDGVADGEPFDTAGDQSVHWEQPSDWSLSTVNGTQGYWVRCVTISASGPISPIQQYRHPYTISWPYVEVQSTAIAGDVPALISQHIRNQSDRNTTANPPSLYSTRTIVGLRSLARGTLFSPYLNCVNEQNPSGIIATVGTIGVFTADTETPTGWNVTCTNALSTGSTAIGWTIPPSISNQWFGQFHAFLRGDQTSGTAGDLLAEIRGVQGRFTYAPTIALTEQVPFPTLNDWAVLDMGRITIPFYGEPTTSEVGPIDLIVYLYGANDTEDCVLYDLILMPVDEWAIDTYDPNPGSPTLVALGRRADPDGTTDAGTGEIIVGNTYLDIDSIANPKTTLRSTLKYEANDLMWTGYIPQAAGPAIAQTSRAQRYWFLQIDDGTSPAIGSAQELVSSVQSWKIQRYISGRGAT